MLAGCPLHIGIETLTDEEAKEVGGTTHSHATKDL
jgi:hypothetical protein